MSSSSSSSSLLFSQQHLDLSPTQDAIVPLLSIPGAMLSIIGSSLILVQVWKHCTNGRRNTTNNNNNTNHRLSPYHQLMGGLSFCDILFSITTAVRVFMLPQDSSTRVLARGNDATCRALGFFVQFNFSTLWYNGLLSFYFLGSVRFGIKAETFAKRIVPMMHIMAIGFNLIAAIMGLITGWFREVAVGHSCWIAEWPEGCLETQDCKSTTIAWIVGAVPTIFFFLTLILNNIIIYCHVRNTIRKTRRRTLSGTTQQERSVQLVATQACLYVGSFYASYIWAFIVQVLDSQYLITSEAAIFPLLVIQAIFLPMQGFFNLIIYVRPRYLTCRRKLPNESTFLILKYLCFGGDADVVDLQSSVQGGVSRSSQNKKQQSSLCGSSGGGGGGGGIGDRRRSSSKKNVNQSIQTTTNETSQTYQGESTTNNDSEYQFDGETTVGTLSKQYSSTGACFNNSVSALSEEEDDDSDDDDDELGVAMLESSGYFVAKVKSLPPSSKTPKTETKKKTRRVSFFGQVVDAPSTKHETTTRIDSTSSTVTATSHKEQQDQKQQEGEEDTTSATTLDGGDGDDDPNKK